MPNNPKRDYKREYENYQGTEQQKHNRALRNAARRHAMENGLVRKGDGQDVDHVTPLSKGGSNAKSNVRVVSKSENRSFSRNSDGSVKRND
jgi:5-methylcytosine-specific restriction endonuclease McrA